MTSSPISQWLRQALDSTAILSKAGWACVLGVSLDVLAQFLAGDAVPDARTLRSLFLILQDHESEAARRACERWHELAARPLREVHPAARSEAPTLAHYVLGPLWEDHRLAVLALPAHEQEQLLQNGIYEATRWAIARNRADAGLPLILSDDDLWAHAEVPRASAEEAPAARDELPRHEPCEQDDVTFELALDEEPAPLGGGPALAHAPAPHDPVVAEGPETQRLARGSTPVLDARKEMHAMERFFPRTSSSATARTMALLRGRPPLHQRLPNLQEQPQEACAPADKRRDE